MHTIRIRIFEIAIYNLCRYIEILYTHTFIIYFIEMIFLKRHLELYILKENYMKIIFKFDIRNLIFDIVINLSQNIFLQEY